MNEILVFLKSHNISPQKGMFMLIIFLFVAMYLLRIIEVLIRVLKAK